MAYRRCENLSDDKEALLNTQKEFNESFDKNEQKRTALNTRFMIRTVEPDNPLNIQIEKIKKSYSDQDFSDLKKEYGLINQEVDIINLKMISEGDFWRLISDKNQKDEQYKMSLVRYDSKNKKEIKRFSPFSADGRYKNSINIVPENPNEMDRIFLCLKKRCFQTKKFMCLPILMLNRKSLRHQLIYLILFLIGLLLAIWFVA